MAAAVLADAVSGSIKAPPDQRLEMDRQLLQLPPAEAWGVIIHRATSSSAVVAQLREQQ